jgi:hypothetical protein
MNQKSSLREDPQFVSRVLTGNTPLDDPRQRRDQGSHSQTDKPWKGNPEKEQRPGTKKSDPDKWQETNTH